ncbi:MAG: transcriptional regulator, partial [Prevotella pectinovora]
MATFDATPCFGATINDIDTDFIKKEYLPQIVDDEVLANDTRDIKEQLAAIHLYDLTHECPTNAAMILFGKAPQYY